MYGTVSRRARSHRDAEQLGAFFDEGNTAGRARSAEHRKTLPHRPTAAGHHQAPFGIGIDGDDPHTVPVGLQLVGDNPGQSRTDMLAHLGADHVDGHRAAAIDAVPNRRLEELTCADARQRGQAGASVSQHEGAPQHRNQEAAARWVGARPEAVSGKANHSRPLRAFSRPRA